MELKGQLSFLKNLSTNENSAFENALIQGKWILLDGIEAAQPELFEKISSLCNKNPSLNLFEKGPEYIYKKGVDSTFKIHDNFKLFITYNSKTVEPQKRLSPGFLNKCPIFSLSELDESIKDIALILSGMIKNGKRIYSESNQNENNEKKMK